MPDGITTPTKPTGSTPEQTAALQRLWQTMIAQRPERKKPTQKWKGPAQIAMEQGKTTLPTTLVQPTEPTPADGGGEGGGGVLPTGGPIGSTPEQTAGLQRLWSFMQENRARQVGRQTGATGMTTTRRDYAIPPELLTEIAGVKERLGGLAEQDPYAGMHGAYEDVIRNMAQAFQTRGSRAAGTARQTALSSGLSPLEAGAIGEETLGQNLQQYFQMLPGLRLEQAGLQQKRWQDLADLMPLFASLAETIGRGTVPTGETTTGYDLSRTGAGAAGQAQQAGAAGRQLPGIPSALERAQEMLLRAQAAQLIQVTEARKKMNEMFYGGGLGPVAGGEQQTAITDLLKGAVPGREGEVTVSPAVEQQNKMEALVQYLRRELGGRTAAPTGTRQAAGGTEMRSILGGK